MEEGMIYHFIVRTNGGFEYSASAKGTSVEDAKELLWSRMPGAEQDRVHLITPKLPEADKSLAWEKEPKS